MMIKDRLEPGSHKDNPKHINDDDDKDSKKVDEEEGGEIASLETRPEEMQTLIPTKLRSPRTILSSDKNITQELTNTVPLPATTTSNTSHSKRQISSKYSHLPSALRRMCRRQGDDDIHSYHNDHQEDDAPPEGEKRVKRHKASKCSKSAREETVIDEDEVISEDETPKLITKLQDVNKRVPTIFDYERMKVTLNDALSNQFKNAEEYAYHLEQTTNFMENQIV
ncbi:hypothetical protein Tco_1563133 [Tanacetum coccineum]